MQLLMSGARASFKVLAGLFRRWFSISPVSNTEIAVVLMFINTSNLVIILLTQRSSVLQKNIQERHRTFKDSLDAIFRARPQMRNFWVQ